MLIQQKDEEGEEARNQRRPHYEREFISSEQPFRMAEILWRKERLQKLSLDLAGKGWGEKRMGKITHLIEIN